MTGKAAGKAKTKTAPKAQTAPAKKKPEPAPKPSPDTPLAKQAKQKDPIKAFQQRVRQRMREGWQLVGRADDPPRARLRRRADTQKGPRRDPDSLMFQHVYREVWIDEDGSLKDEETPGEG